MKTTAKTDPVAIARMKVTRAVTGKIEYIYSYEKVPIKQFRRWWKLHKHLRFMRREDRLERKQVI